MLNHLEGLRRKSRAGDRSERKTQTERLGKADFRCVIAVLRRLDRSRLLDFNALVHPVIYGA